ncbi:MAG: Tim44 domain-containing protein [Desulfovibrio sp.]|jgi:predicted lipid-binding transport protein (Tim44 family)
MKQMKKVLCTVLAFGLACAVFADLALAKRMGGGGSFGGRSSYSRSYSPSTPSSPSQVSPTRSSQQQSAAPGGAMAQPRSPGMFGGMGWGLGGLMAGGLIGSMLFGGAGWGAGGGIGMFDIILIGLVIFLGFKLLRRRSASTQGSAAQPTWRQTAADPRAGDPRARAGQSWDHLRSGTGQPGSEAPGSVTGAFGVANAADAATGPVVPEGFNVPDFLEGAKTVYARLQHSWDRRDLNDIELFTTPEVLAEIRRQAAADPEPSKTELLLVNAKLLEFREERQDTVATVLFDVLMREDPTEERSKQIREVWHFSRPTADLAANWRLEGIQQLEG